MEVDVNSDGLMDQAEMLQSVRFDQNKDGEVSEEEVNFFLAGNEAYSEEEFINTGWPLLKPHVIADETTEGNRSTIDPRGRPTVTNR